MNNAGVLSHRISQEHERLVFEPYEASEAGVGAICSAEGCSSAILARNRSTTALPLFKLIREIRSFGRCA